MVAPFVKAGLKALKGDAKEASEVAKKTHLPEGLSQTLRDRHEIVGDPDFFADGLPQYRVSPHPYDPSYESDYTKSFLVENNSRPSTFASTNREWTRKFHGSVSEMGDEEAKFFIRFPNIHKDNILDLSNPEHAKLVQEIVDSKLRSPDPMLDGLREFRDSMPVVTGRTNWAEVEDMAREGLLDDLPLQFKAIRLDEGGAMNTMYLGRNTPKSYEQLSFPETVSRLDFIRDLQEYNRAIELGKDTTEAIAKVKHSVSEAMAKYPDEFDAPQGLWSLHNFPDDWFTDSAIPLSDLVNENVPSAVRNAMAYAENKADIKYLLEHLDDGSSLYDDLRNALRNTPDKDFDAKDFILTNKLWSVLLGAFGISTTYELTEEDLIDG